MPESFFGIPAANVTPALRLPYQAQVEGSSLTALVLETLLHGAPVSGSTTTPPNGSTPYDTYIVPNGATGAWSGRAGYVAIATPPYVDGYPKSRSVAWTYFKPRVGTTLFVQDAAAAWTYSGSLKTILDAVTVHDPVRLIATGNGTLASAYQNGATVDSVVLVTGDRILLAGQTTTNQNGIYTVNASGAPTRAADAATWAGVLASGVMVTAGTVNAGSMWRCTVAPGGTIDSTAVTYVKVPGLIPGTPWVQGIGNSTVPASATAPGTPGEITFDTAAAYFCVAANTWRKVAIASF